LLLKQFVEAEQTIIYDPCSLQENTMKYDEFIAKVERRANLNSRVEAERAVGATLETLAERLAGGEPKDLAAQLPPEIAIYLQPPLAGVGAPFTLAEFFRLVSEREGVPLSEASLHARAVIAVLCEAVSMGEIENVRAQLPEDLRQLFMVENEGDLPEVKNIPTQGTQPPLVSDMGVDVDQPFPPSKLYTE